MSDYDFNGGVPPLPGNVWLPADEYGPGRWVAPTTGSQAGNILTVWPSNGYTPPDTSYLPPSTLGPGWADYDMAGVASDQGYLVYGVPVRVVLDILTEEGDWPGWTIGLYEAYREQEPVSAAIATLDRGLISGLPDPSRPAVVPYARLEPESPHPEKISRVMTIQPLNNVTDVPVNALPASGRTVNVQRRLTDLVFGGNQYLVVTGGKPMSVRVVDAGLVKDKTPQSDRFLKNTYQATIAPGLPPLIFTTDYINDSRMFPKNYAPNASGIISGQGVYGPAGYTSSDRNDDVIVRFPAGSGASPLYISSVEVLNPESLHQRQLAETDIRNRIDAAIKAEENRKYLFGKAGIQETPAFTPEMVKSASALLAAPAAMMLNRAPAGIQLSATGTGVMTAVGEWAGSIAGALWRGAVGTAAASTAGPMVAAASTLFFSRPAGEGSDKVPGRDINMMAAQVSLFNTGKVKIDPGMKTVDLPVRGFISTDSNGRQSVKLVRTGAGGVPATVPVLSAVRDKVTGLDKITVPAVAGAPSRTILVNPVPVGPAAPSHTGNSTPVPVTPVHTGTDVKQADSIVTTTLPAADIPALQDFIYWQPDATGTGVEPIYVVFSSPPKSFSHGYKHYPPKGVPWKDIVKSTANGGEAKFKPDINIPDLDVDVWNTGQTTSLRSYWKVKQYDHIIGAYEGKETRWAVVKESQGVIHSHPISEEKAKRYIK
ncbi:S-type pyocin domain-containing protein [Klebsiella michiganensis]|uniref:S-type pyocin domain-containing protein n=1 Tax=Klebsiella michiganensis TaxID=1134687 RepID=UPI0032DAABE7